MVAFALAFLFGVVSLQNFSHLPDYRWPVVVAAVAFFILGIFKRDRRYACLPLIAAAGFGWTYWHAQQGIQQKIPAALEGVSLAIEGQIIGIPHAGSLGQTFLMELHSLAGKPAQGVVHLLWSNPPGNYKRVMNGGYT